jgi:hypothetical protein
MTHLNFDLINMIDEQTSLINKQKEIITQLLNENAELEALLKEVVKGG